MTDTFERFDYDPEDSYDADDSIGDRLDVLERVVDDLRDRRDGRWAARVTDLRRVIDNVDREDLDRGDARRLRQIRDDLEDL